MGDYLQRYAYANIWCAPSQDNQVIISPAKITPLNGAWLNFRYQWRNVKLPSTTGRFHVYHVGQVHPSIIGLLAVSNQWIPVCNAMTELALLVDIYTERGIQIPRGECWYIVTGDKNLLLAVRKSQQIDKGLNVDLETEKVFMRLYTNAFFQSHRSSGLGSKIIAKSARPMSVLEINDLQAKIALLPTSGHLSIFVNGIKVNRLDLVNTQPGDYVDYIHDSSVSRVITFDVDTLQEFNSNMDGLRKYLLHYSADVDTIEYQDDCDTYLMREVSAGYTKGVYMHKNDSRMLRMVTHRDYSIPVTRVEGLASANEFLKNLPGLKVQVIIRNSGLKRPLVFENNRIHELYRLPSEGVQAAMLGFHAQIPVWSASSLEESNYVKVMKANIGTITRQSVQDALGYNALSSLLGNTPTKVRLESGQKLIDIPEGLRGHCTVYEYDSSGKLLGFSVSTVDDTHGCVYPTTAFAEVIYGLGGTRLDIYENVLSANVSNLNNYRFYQCPIVNGTPSMDWSDVTGTNNYLGRENSFQWIGDPTKYRRVMSNKYHLAYEFMLTKTAGVYEFIIAHTSFGGVLKAIDIPLGNLCVFINGYSLIEGLDFVLKGARVVILTKEYFTPEDLQHVTIRYTGFCQSDMSREAVPELGYVYHGVLSHNKRYDVRDDRVMRIVCSGRVRLRDELEFSEDGVTTSITNALNGAPYAIRDIVVPVSNYLVSGVGLEDTTNAMREKSKVIDKQVSDYLTLYLGEQVIDEPSAVAARYKIYSPFLARIIDDLLTGVLWHDKFYEHMGDDYVRQVCAPYLPILAMDPLSSDNLPDDRYVVIHPHCKNTYISLDMYRYRVLTRITAIYGRGKVDLASTVSISTF